MRRVVWAECMYVETDHVHCACGYVRLYYTSGTILSRYSDDAS